MKSAHRVTSQGGAVRKWLRRSRTLRAARFLPYLIPFWALSAFVRVRADRILFLSDSHDGFTGNMRFVREEILRQAPETDVWGVFKPRLSARRPLREAVRLPYLIATSRVIVVDDFYPLIYFFRLRRQTRLVQLWHAAGAFKRVGHSRAGLPGGPTRKSEIHGNYTDAVVSSRGIVNDYAEAFGIAREKVKPWGVPRSDVFFDEVHISRTRARVRHILGIEDGERFVLYAPTFRGSGQLTAESSPDADWPEVARALGPGWRVGIRQHPFVARVGLPSDILDASVIPEMNDLLMGVDVLITDYSSSIFEFALLRRPVVFFVPDLDQYTESRSFFRPFDDYVIGPVVREADQLTDAILNARADDPRLPHFLEEFCGALDGRSSARIAARLLRDT